MRINVLERPHSPDEIAEYAEQEANSSSFTSTLISVFRDEPRRPYERIYRIYFPVFIANVRVYREQTDTETVTKDFTLGINGITGSVGREDAFPTGSNRDVDPASVIDPVLDESEVRSKVDEWVFKYLDRSYRLFQMPTYDLEIHRRYLLYWLIDRGSLATSYVVNDLTERCDNVDRMMGIDEYYRNSLSSDT